jgi:hypothetical protein
VPSFWLVTLVAAVFTLSLQTAGGNNDWPSVKTGIWEESGTRVFPGGKTITASGVKVQSCGAPEGIFMSWAGSDHAELEKAGCSYESRRTAEKTWKIVTECELRKVGTSRGVSTVTLRSDSEFETDREFREGARVYRLHLTARRVGDCPQ